MEQIVVEEKLGWNVAQYENYLTLLDLFFAMYKSIFMIEGFRKTIDAWKALNDNYHKSDQVKEEKLYESC